MIRVFIGVDSRETVAYHVLAHSIMRRASRPFVIVPLDQRMLRIGGVYKRPHNEPASTEFSYTRFLVPRICGFEGTGIYLDSDMLCLADIGDLEALADRTVSVSVCKHDYVPRAAVKMDGHPQIVYPRKNWSSLMVFNAAKCGRLNARYTNEAPPADLHRLAWAKKIGALPLEWNYLVGEDNQATVPPKIIHYTNGGPWFPDYKKCEYADEWRAEYQHMTGQPYGD